MRHGAFLEKSIQRSSTRHARGGCHASLTISTPVQRQQSYEIVALMAKSQIHRAPCALWTSSRMICDLFLFCYAFDVVSLFDSVAVRPMRAAGVMSSIYHCCICGAEHCTRIHFCNTSCPQTVFVWRHDHVLGPGSHPRSDPNSGLEPGPGPSPVFAHSRSCFAFGEWFVLSSFARHLSHRLKLLAIQSLVGFVRCTVTTAKVPGSVARGTGLIWRSGCTDVR